MFSLLNFTCESHSVELSFAQWFEKVLALFLVCGWSQDTYHAGSLRKIGPCDDILSVRMLLVSKRTDFSFFFLGWLRLINFDPKNKFSMMFVNMFWGAEGFVYMWVPFEFLSFYYLCLVFSLEKQKKSNLSGRKQLFLVESTFSLKNLWN